MLTLEEIKNINFHRAGFGGGYKTEEVDLFIDRIIEKIEKMQEEAEAAEKKIKELEKSSEWLKNEKDSLSNVFIKAQIVADSIERESKETAEKTLSDAKFKSETMITEATAQSKALVAEAQEKADRILKEATENSTNLVTLNNEKIHHQKVLYEQLQIEVAKFRADMLRIYKEHLRILKTLPNDDVVKASVEKMEEKYPTSSVEVLTELTEVNSTVDTDTKMSADSVEKEKLPETAKKENPSFYDKLVDATTKSETSSTSKNTDESIEKKTKPDNVRQPIIFDEDKDISSNS